MNKKVEANNASSYLVRVKIENRLISHRFLSTQYLQFKIRSENNADSLTSSYCPISSKTSAE